MNQEVQISITPEELRQMIALMEIGLLTLKTFRKQSPIYQYPKYILTEESSKCMLEKYKQYSKVLETSQ